jgi:hypothetical protein
LKDISTLNQGENMPLDVESCVLISNVLNSYSAPSTAAEKAALFAEECSMTVHGGAVFKGRNTIGRFFSATNKMKREGHPFRHHLSSIKINNDGPDKANLTFYFLVLNNAAPDHWGIYRDTFAKINGEWFFKTRVITIEGAVPKGSGTGAVKFEAAK